MKLRMNCYGKVNRMNRIPVSVDTKKVATIENEEYPVLFEFEIAHIGWECDSVGYVIEYQGEPRLVLTNHGSPYLVSSEHPPFLEKIENRVIRQDTEILSRYIRLYQSLIDQTNKAIEMIGTEKEPYNE